MAVEDTERLFLNILKKTDYQVSKVVDYDYSLKWFRVFETDKYKKSVGLAENGCWVIYSREEIMVLNSERNFMRAVFLLEMDKNTIKNILEGYLQSKEVQVSADKVFPFSSIVKAGLEFGSEYWAELAFNWLEELGLNAKIYVKDTLEKIVQEKLLTQKLRHKAIKHLVNLRKSSDFFPQK